MRKRTVVISAMLLLFVASCWAVGVVHGPYWGTVLPANPEHAGDVGVWLRCHGPFIHGHVTTDEAFDRANRDGDFSIGPSLQFPVTTSCDVIARHPSYVTAQIRLTKLGMQRVPTLTLLPWQTLFSGSPDDEQRSREVLRYLYDVRTWVDAFSPRERRKLVTYVPEVHEVFRTAVREDGVDWPHRQFGDAVKTLVQIEAQTGYAYPLEDYLAAAETGDVRAVLAHISGGGLRDAWLTRPALSLAAYRGHVDVIDVLLKANEMVLDGCRSPIAVALAERQWQSVAHLVAGGVDVNVVCGDQRLLGDALKDFARYGKLEELRLWLDSGVPVDLLSSQGLPPLAYAVADGEAGAVQLLLAAGANADTTDGKGLPLVELAARSGHTAIQNQLEQAQTRAIAVAAAVPDAARAPQVAPVDLDLVWRQAKPSQHRLYTETGAIHALSADPSDADVLWVGTAQGLLRVEPETGTIRRWARQHGLPSSDVRDVWFDSKSRYLWLSTAQGLARAPYPAIDPIERVEVVVPIAGGGRGLAHAAHPDVVWYWQGRHVYQVPVAGDRVSAYEFPTTVQVLESSADGITVYEVGRAWRIDPVSHQREPLGDIQAGGTNALRTTSIDGSRWGMADEWLNVIGDDGRWTQIMNLASPFGHQSARTVYTEGKQVFVGVREAPLLVLDLTTRKWQTVAELTNVARIRRAAGRNELLVLGEGNYWWLDTETLQSERLTFDFVDEATGESGAWTDVVDAEFDGLTFWVVRRYGGKDHNPNVYRFSAGRSKRLEDFTDDGMLKIWRVGQDPDDSNRLWLSDLRDRRLLAMDKTSLTYSDAPGEREARVAAALARPALRELSLYARETAQPGSADLVWIAMLDEVKLTRAENSAGAREVGTWWVPNPGGELAISHVDGTTAWIANGSGLFEFPIEYKDAHRVHDAQELEKLLASDRRRARSSREKPP